MAKKRLGRARRTEDRVLARALAKELTDEELKAARGGGKCLPSLSTCVYECVTYYDDGECCFDSSGNLLGCEDDCA